ncbi:MULTISPECIES: hypothetical protein [unclassified Legionella]|uniref:hypothetical protein n=1 Tax=unclassified Legionella TaxID=2622702 RepID=UPI0010568399|nr:MULTISPECIES: hypothetical protein [unclassified Legionella]MDI9818896.1 hypothetical protein [Legionella sp. PL877]
MSEEKAENDLSIWLSTYGLVTAERILESYKIRLQQKELISAIKNPNTFYHHLLRVPLKNVLNGIILQQAHDYQVYAQKLFVDYLLSGETGKGEDSPGGLTREDLEKERQGLISMGDAFHQQTITHNNLIAESQKKLIQLVDEWHKALSVVAKKIRAVLSENGLSVKEESIINSVNILLMEDSGRQKRMDLKSNNWSRVEKIIDHNLSADARQAFVDELTTLREFMVEADTKLADFIPEIAAMTNTLREYRTHFYELILRVNELIKLLPEYRIDPAQTEENRESIHFDKEIGG